MPRGALRTEVIGWLRLGHAKRRPRARGADRRGKIPDMVRIQDRPPEVAERVVPGHWEGDLIKGACNAIHRAGQAGQCHRRIGRGGLRSGAPPDRGTAAPVLDARSGARNGGTPEIDGRHRDEGVIRRPA